MDDEEAKRIQEEQDKQLTKEYKDVTNPKKPDYDKIINEVGFQPDWDEIDQPMKGQGLVNEALMWGASAGIAAAAKPIAGMLGTAKTIDMGLNLIDPNASDVALDQAMEFIKPANPIKVGAKGIRIFKGMLDDVFDRRTSPEDYIVKSPISTIWEALRGGPDIGTARDVSLPEGASARKWFKKVDQNRVREEVLSQGGTEFQARQIYKDHYKKLEGPKGIKATIKELNDMWKLWAPNTQIKLVSDTETGGKKMMMMTKKGDVKTWEFDHDHIQAVINTNRPEGGLKGADMADNIEIMFRAMNREKSNIFELDPRLLSELGVPYDFKEFIFNKLNPDLVPEGIPQRWKEVFSKSILNDYYELKANTPSSKHSALMGRLIRKYKKVFTNKQLLADIEYLEDIPFWKKYPPNEIPKWAQTLELPNDPLTDKFWNQLPPKAKKRWENMVRRKHQELKFEMEGYKPSKGRYRIQPDD